VLTKREMQIKQLAARLLVQPGDRRLPVLGLCQATPDVLARKPPPLRDENPRFIPPRRPRETGHSERRP
jgi:hypothetical protein